MDRKRWIHAALVAVFALPAAALGVRLIAGSLGANPIEELTHETGEWALRLMLASLAVTPARQWLGWSRLAPYRRTLGLLAFGYACAHMLVYFAVDLFFDWRAILEAIVERPYVTAGFTAFACLVPLAVTSTRRWMRRLGRRWNTLHRLVYVAAVAAAVHFLWLVKADLREPLVYAAILAALLAARPLYRLRRSRL
ncbi:MAG: sulfoxide reductase heme-binding subunit YedZ [Proteobacteria bacterium]|nr:sulfoxide reductase heme-binding subunit YedZ [Pseudomonadota bacterium]